MTITVKFPAPLEADLRRYAQAHSKATSLVVREAVAQYLVQARAAEAPPSAEALGADLFGRYSGPAGLAQQRKVMLADAWADKHAAAAPPPAAAPQAAAPRRSRSRRAAHG